ncbi:unnamed protein product, partial [Staurois parvus]
MASLPGSSADHLSSQESLASGKGQAEDSTSGIFSATQTSDSPIPDIDSENNSCSGEEKELVNEQITDATADTAANTETVKEVETLTTSSELEEELHTVSEPHPLRETTSAGSGELCYFIGVTEGRKSLDSQTDTTETLEDTRVSTTQCHIPPSSIGASMSESAYTFTSDPLQVIKSIKLERHDQDQALASSDEEDIYGHRIPHSSSDASVAEIAVSQDLTRSMQEESMLVKSEQLAESWMVYFGPTSGILSLVVSEKYIWCLDYKGSLYCSSLPGAGLRWQKFEDTVQQVAVSPSGNLLWKIEQKTDKAFACGKVTIK